MTGTALLAAICAAGFVVSLVLIAVGVRGRRPEPGVFRPRQPPMQQIRGVVSGRGGRILLALAVAAVVWVVTAWPVAAVFAALIAVGGPYFFGSGREAKQRIARLDALEEWTRRLADTIATGVAPVQAIVRSAANAPRPIAAEVIALGNALATPRLDRQAALDAFARDVADPLGILIAKSLKIAVSATGSGRVTDVLRALAEAVSEAVKARRHVEVLHAGPRRESRTIVIVEALFLVGVIVLTDYAEPYGTALGQLVLAGIGLVMLLALVLLRRFSQSAPPVRTVGGAA